MSDDLYGRIGWLNWTIGIIVAFAIGEPGIGSALFVISTLSFVVQISDDLEMESAEGESP